MTNYHSKMESERQELVNAYKCELKKYSFYYRRYRYWQDTEYVIQHEEEGLLGKDLSQDCHGSSDPNAKTRRRLKLIEEREHAEQMKTAFWRKIRAIENTLDKIGQQEGECSKELSEAIMNIYCKKNSTAEKEGRRIGMSRREITRRMDKEIEKLALCTVENDLI